MKRITTVLTSLVLFSLLLPIAVSAAAFMKIGDIKGEAMDDSNSTEVQSVRWMAPESIQKKQYSRSATGSPGTVSITKPIDKSSPQLMKMASSGGEIGEMSIADGEKRYLLKKVRVVSVKKQGQKEVVTLRFNHREEYGQVQKAAAANHNSTRSNRKAAATDYNSSRSNKRG